jgi:hypothetical protein
MAGTTGLEPVVIAVQWWTAIDNCLIFKTQGDISGLGKDSFGLV